MSVLLSGWDQQPGLKELAQVLAQVVAQVVAQVLAQGPRALPCVLLIFPGVVLGGPGGSEGFWGALVGPRGSRGEVADMVQSVLSEQEVLGR